MKNMMMNNKIAQLNQYLVDSGNLLYCLCKVASDNNLLDSNYLSDDNIIAFINDFIIGYEASPMFENIFKKKGKRCF